MRSNGPDGSCVDGGAVVPVFAAEEPVPPTVGWDRGGAPAEEQPTARIRRKADRVRLVTACAFRRGGRRGARRDSLSDRGGVASRAHALGEQSDAAELADDGVGV